MTQLWQVKGFLEDNSEAWEKKFKKQFLCLFFEEKVGKNPLTALSYRPNFWLCETCRVKQLINFNFFMHKVLKRSFCQHT